MSLLKGGSLGLAAAGAVLSAVSGGLSFKDGDVPAGTLSMVSAGASAAAVAASAASATGVLAAGSTAAAICAPIPLVGGIVAAVTGLASFFVGLFGGDKRKTAELEF